MDDAPTGRAAARRSPSHVMDKPLTETDRRILARLEGLYGPPRRVTPTAERPAIATRDRGSIGLLVRTVLLAGAAVLLVTGTEPGRTMSGWIVHQLAVIYALASDLFR